MPRKDFARPFTTGYIRSEYKRSLFSKDRQTLPQLKNALTVYRLVFGQPRQDDLLEYLTDRVPTEKLVQVLAGLVIDRTP